MKTGYIIAGLAVVGGIFYLMTKGAKKVVPGTVGHGNVSNSGVGTVWSGAVSSLAGAIPSLVGAFTRPSAPPVGSQAYQYDGVDYGPGTTLPVWGSTNDNPSGTGNDVFGMPTPDNPYGTG